MYLQFHFSYFPSLLCIFSFLCTWHSCKQCSITRRSYTCLRYRLSINCRCEYKAQYVIDRFWCCFVDILRRKEDVTSEPVKLFEMFSCCYLSLLSPLRAPYSSLTRSVQTRRTTQKLSILSSLFIGNFLHGAELFVRRESCSKAW
jgi:hypothetical protein